MAFVGVWSLDLGIGATAIIPSPKDDSLHPPHGVLLFVMGAHNVTLDPARRRSEDNNQTEEEGLPVH